MYRFLYVVRSVDANSRLGVRSVKYYLVHVVDASPIKCGRSVRSPLSFRCLVGRPIIIYAVLVLVFVVEPRCEPCVSLFSSYFGDKGVGFAWDSFASCGVSAFAPGFLVVDDGVFRAD